MMKGNSNFNNYHDAILDSARILTHNDRALCPLSGKGEQHLQENN